MTVSVRYRAGTANKSGVLANHPW